MATPSSSSAIRLSMRGDTSIRPARRSSRTSLAARSAARYGATRSSSSPTIRELDTNQGVSTGYISVPTVAERSGDFNDLTGSVSGPYLASLLTQSLGYAVTPGEPYTSVFPGGVIPQSAWSAPGKNLLQYIPSPNVSASQYSTSAFAQTVLDNKGSVRIDGNSRLGQISGYYFIDDYNLDNPYPGSVAGASIPGFDALYIGRAQLLSLSDNKLIGSNTVNEFHFGYLRNANIIGQPKGGLGVSLASQGFVTGAGTPGIYVQAPQFEGVENITFPTFVMGVPITNGTQINNTYYLERRPLESHRRAHSEGRRDSSISTRSMSIPNATFNGTFNIDGTETGDPYADFLIGVPSNFTQSSGQPFYLRNRYFGAYGTGQLASAKRPHHQRRPALGRDQAFLGKVQPDTDLGSRSRVHALPRSAPRTARRRRSAEFQRPSRPPIQELRAENWIRLLAPLRSGILEKHLRKRRQEQYSSQLRHLLHRVSRLGWPALCTPFRPSATTISVLAPPLMATPFITAATGVNNGQRFPFPFPPHNVSASHPDTSVNWANFAPLSADPFFYYRNRVPYIDNYMFSIQRQITSSTLC